MGFYPTYGKIAQRVSLNAKGEVVTADHSTNNGFDRSFEFDGIGNRKKSADSITLPTADNYSANTLNQLTTVNGGARIHDADGNITDNGEHLYEWDAENRLIEIKLKSDNSTVAEYAYDFQSRRITKTVLGNETNYVYDKWNPIAEFTGSTLSKSYTWGLDISSYIQGSGGVGGLLSVSDGSAAYYPTFDGNGNVSEYLDATGTVVAHYEYDSFGRAIASGIQSNDFIHQFSTKPLDQESGLHYYGYRYYDSSIGRWLGRDPVEEFDSFNLFAFLDNDGINRIDLFGLAEKRNCQSLTKEFSRDIRSGSLGTKVGFGVSVSGSVSMDFSLGGEKCEECCSDGSWKEVTRGVWSVSFKGAVALRGGLHADFTWGGHGVSGFLGISGSLSAAGTGKVEVTDDGCTGSTEGSGSVTFDVGGAITGGGNLTLQAGWFTFDIARAEVTGSASRSYGLALNCTKDGCSVDGVTPNGEWNKSISAKGCAFGTCYTHQF